MKWNPMVPELLVGDFGASCAFYVELLGFTVCYERTDPPFAYLDLGGAQLMIEQDHPTAWLTADLEAPRGRSINLQIEDEDASGMCDRLKTAGHHPFRDLADTWYEIGGGLRSGLRQFLLQDPDGYLLRFAEPLGERSRSALSSRVYSPECVELDFSHLPAWQTASLGGPMGTPETFYGLPARIDPKKVSLRLTSVSSCPRRNVSGARRGPVSWP